jgi:hypothetical protein
MTEESQPPPEPRESIWSVSPGWKSAYFFLFSLQTICGVGLLSWKEVGQYSNEGAVQTALDIIFGTASIGVAAATITVSITELMRGSMVVGAYLEEKLLKPLREKRRMEREQWIAQRQAEGRAQGRAQGRAEGRVDNQKIWEAWNQRRLEALERGEPFDESTPTTQEEP